jgi:DNA polymerase-3 subunit gamma/tau
MAYTVLARKYRSQTFEDVIGQDAIAQTLQNAIKTDRVAHAYLFSGTRGVGKTTVARIVAKSLNCLSSDGPTSKPCCKCESCIAVNSGDDIDVIEIDGATNNGVDQVRELRQNAVYRPARCRFKIYIIDEVHMLSTSAFNALLKILEEPPSHVKFIFATTEPNKVIATIQSRCQRFDFSNIGPTVIAEQLRSILKLEKIKYDDEMILSLAKLANGSMRDALSLLDRLLSTGVEPLSAELLEQFLGRPNSSKICELIDKIGDSDAAGTLGATEELITSGLGEIQILDAMVEYMRDLLVVKSAGASSELLIMSSQQRELFGKLAEKFDVAAIVYNITALEKLRWSLKNSDTPRALLDALLVRFTLSEHFLNVDELLNRLQTGSSTSALKKNHVNSSSTPRSAIEQPKDTAKKSPPVAPTLLDLQSIKDIWQDMLTAISDKFGPGTRVHFNSAEPVGFDNGVLTVSFPASGQVSKQMLERNGRSDELGALLSEHCGGPVRLKFELCDSDQDQGESPAAAIPAAANRKKNELISDPAVKTVLLGFDATITGIEEDR